VIVALVLECCFFGIFTILSCGTLWIIINKSDTRRPLVVTVCVMYILAFAQLAIDVQRAIEGFVEYADVPKGSLVFYGKLNDATELAKNIVYVLQTIVGDSIVVWRCYIVWGKRWPVTIVPILMLLLTAVAGFGTTYIFSKVQPGDRVFISQLYPWITTYFSLTLATTVICTTLIAVRIWRGQMMMRQARLQSNLMPIMVTLVESGAIYAAALLSVIVTYATKNNAQYIVLDLLTSLIGIVFSLIIIRVGLGVSSNGSVSISRRSRGISMPTTTTRSKDDTFLDYPLKPTILPIGSEDSEFTC